MSIIEVLDKEYDDVIRSNYLVAKTTYGVALEKLVPLIDRFEQQRNTLPPHFYAKLEKDIINGCIMPPLTIALVDPDGEKIKAIQDPSFHTVESYVNENITESFVLDGIQRLSTLKRLGANKISVDRPLFLNILICNSMDKLLYRMITLNNGQKPMSARHQVEILAGNLYDFDDLGITVQTEKEQKRKKIRGSFSKGDVIKAYLAFISNSINIDNQKIIEAKLDELITDRIIESDVTEREVEFSDIIDLINNFIKDNETLTKWFTLPNNLIGFAAGVSSSYSALLEESPVTFQEALGRLEETMASLELSKIRLGLARRMAVQHFINNYSELKALSTTSLTDSISMLKI